MKKEKTVTGYCPLVLDASICNCQSWRKDFGNGSGSVFKLTVRQDKSEAARPRNFSQEAEKREPREKGGMKGKNDGCS